jgi:hypothetical protein
MTKPIHPREIGPDGKLVRHRRTRAEITRARIIAEMQAGLEADLPKIQDRLALATPQQIRQAERTLARWSRPYRWS